MWCFSFQCLCVIFCSYGLACIFSTKPQSDQCPEPCLQTSSTTSPRLLLQQPETVHLDRCCKQPEPPTLCDPPQRNIGTRHLPDSLSDSPLCYQLSNYFIYQILERYIIFAFALQHPPSLAADLLQDWPSMHLPWMWRWGPSGPRHSEHQWRMDENEGREMGWCLKWVKGSDCKSRKSKRWLTWSPETHLLETQSYARDDTVVLEGETSLN